MACGGQSCRGEIYFEIGRNIFCNLDKYICSNSSSSSLEIWCHVVVVCRAQACTTCGLSSLANFLKILSSKRVCCVFRDIRDKNAVNQGFWSKTTVFSLPATKMHYLLILWLPHLYNLLQPGSRKQHKYSSIHEYLYLAINKAKFALLLFKKNLTVLINSFGPHQPLTS